MFIIKFHKNCDKEKKKTLENLLLYRLRLELELPEASTGTFHKYFSASYGTARLYSCAGWSTLGCWLPLIQNNDLGFSTGSKMNDYREETRFS